MFELIEQKPARLREVTGIGPKRAARIIASWAEHKVIREIMLFLHANAICSAMPASARAILLDLDGTLIDSSPAFCRAVEPHYALSGMCLAR